MLVPAANSSSFLAVTSTAATHTAMTKPKRYVFTANTTCYIKQGPAASSPVASAGTGSMLVPAGLAILIDSNYGDTLSVVRDSADGASTLQELALV